MRIINGKNRGKKIEAPASLPVRPTTDLGKESLFNILNNYFFFDRVKVLDLFSGTGNITYEFASRGAVSVTAVDNHQGCTDFIRRTITQLGYDNVSIIRGDAFHFVAKCRQKFDIIFADPPYDTEEVGQIVDTVFKNQLLNPDGWLVIEHSRDYDFSKHPKFYQHRKYGKLNFSFLVNMSEPKTEVEETE
jgi:16S rRNA (guanine(966)-N(2))-methyltransferase RsmD